MPIRPFQIFVAASSLALTLLVLELIRRRKIKDELWLPWLVVSITPFVMSFWISPWAELAHMRTTRSALKSSSYAMSA